MSRPSGESPEERELIVDERTAIRRLYDARSSALLAQLGGEIGHDGVRQTALQEAFIKAMDNPYAFRFVSDQEAWLRAEAAKAAPRLSRHQRESKSVTMPDFEQIVATAHQRQRRRLLVRLVVAAIVLLVALGLFIHFGLEKIDCGLGGHVMPCVGQAISPTR